VDLKGSRGIIPPYPLKINGYPLSLPSIFGKKECRRRGERREGKKEEEKRAESSLYVLAGFATSNNRLCVFNDDHGEILTCKGFYHKINTPHTWKRICT